MSFNTTKDAIVRAADDLFYRQGFESTSFADIAKVVGITRGNFYHHFKTKNDLLEAVIAKRLSDTEAMLVVWQKEKAAADRIKCFIHILIANKADIKIYGCPVGTLTGELGKLEHPSLVSASRVFSLFSDWLEEQFLELGHGEQSRQLALHVLVRSQGIATLASAFNDEGFIYQEVELLHEWLATYS